MILNPQTRSILETAQVARLATSCNDQPHLIPVVFVFDGIHIYIPLDEKKKKSASPENLKRVKNIMKNPRVAFLVDRYDDDWTELFFIMITGKASILPAENCAEAFGKLASKYPQYQKVGHGSTCIRIKPERVTAWKNS